MKIIFKNRLTIWRELDIILLKKTGVVYLTLLSQ